MSQAPATGGYRAVGVSKRYAGTLALDDVTVGLRLGEIHALVGENGAGKSTLVKILTGAEAPTAGQLLLDDEPVTFHSPRDAQRCGIAVVHQDNQLFDEMTVWENVAATASLPVRVGPLVSRRGTSERVQRVFDEFGIEIDPMRKANELPAAERKLVEVARSLLLEPRYLFLDEPTATLTPDETEHLAVLVRRLRDAGRGVVLVTHHLEEVLALADRTTVLRDGRWAGTFERSELSRDVLLEAMLGGLVEHRPRTAGAATPEVALEVRGMRLSRHGRPVDLAVHAGEIVGLVGLVGSGTSALLARLGGATSSRDGAVLVGGRPASLRSPAHAVGAGLGYLPADRKAGGIVPDQSVAVNVALPALPRLSRLGWCDTGAIGRLAEETKARLGIRCRTTRQPIRTLSGGNQQKALLGRWLASGVRVLLVDEPTHGVDIGARAEIHEHLRRFAADGGTVVFASSDLDEVLVLADRILIFRKGEIGAELAPDEPGLDRRRLLELMTGLSRQGEQEVVA